MSADTLGVIAAVAVVVIVLLGLLAVFGVFDSKPKVEQTYHAEDHKAESWGRNK